MRVERAPCQNEASHYQNQSRQPFCSGEDTGQGLTDQAVAGLAKALGRRQKKVKKQAKKGVAIEVKPRAENDAAQGTEAVKATKNPMKRKLASTTHNGGKARQRDSSGMLRGEQEQSWPPDSQS